MRIDPFGSLSQELEAGGSSIPQQGTGAASPAATTAATSLPDDTATLSSGSVSVAALSSQALSIASVMEAKVSALRQAVSSGQYAIDPSQIAEAMLSDGV